MATPARPSGPAVSLAQALSPEALQVVFQPIFDVAHGGLALHAVEALVRGPKGTSLESAEALFTEIRRRHVEPEADRACVTAILTAARELPAPLPLAVNVHAATLDGDEEFVAFLARTALAAGVVPSRLVVEIVQRQSPWAGQVRTRPLADLRSLGARIALDDVGLGNASFRNILDCRPDYLKVDGHFVRGCHADPLRRAVLRSVAVLAEGFGARVVAEWVEQAQDLRAVQGQGIELVQGRFFLGAAPADRIAGELSQMEVPLS